MFLYIKLGFQESESKEASLLQARMIQVLGLDYSRIGDRISITIPSEKSEKIKVLARKSKVALTVNSLTFKTVQVLLGNIAHVSYFRSIRSGMSSIMPLYKLTIESNFRKEVRSADSRKIITDCLEYVITMMDKLECITIAVRSEVRPLFIIVL